MKRIAGKRITRIIPSPELRGDSRIYFIQEQYEDMYYCSPAIYTLLEDESLKQQLTKDLKIVDVREMMKEEYQALVEKLIKSKNNYKKKTTRKKKDE